MRILALFMMLIFLAWACKDQTVKDAGQSEIKEGKKKLTLFVGAASNPLQKRLSHFLKSKPAWKLKPILGAQDMFFHR